MKRVNNKENRSVHDAKEADMYKILKELYIKVGKDLEVNYATEDSLGIYGVQGNMVVSDECIVK
ncbi:hypothetical protein [Mesobacillus zeae]|uniref:hypothetical protein n=1 Tax=Mesobacillus zeae TaxID=1917180 RepID=UPI00115F6246|nr:hypothetical protein [Mesobacillus zeae]